MSPISSQVECDEYINSTFLRLKRSFFIMRTSNFYIYVYTAHNLLRLYCIRQTFIRFLVVVVVVVVKLQRDLGLVKCAMRRWRQTVAAPTGPVEHPLERVHRISLHNVVWKTIPRLRCPNDEELFALLTVPNVFQDISTPYTRTRVTETWFLYPIYFVKTLDKFKPLNRVTPDSSLF